MAYISSGYNTKLFRSRSGAKQWADRKNKRARKYHWQVKRRSGWWRYMVVAEPKKG